MKKVSISSSPVYVCLWWFFRGKRSGSVKTQQQQPATEKLKSLKPLSLPRKNPKQKNRKLKSPKLKLLPTVLLQRKHLHSLLNNSKHTDNKSHPYLSILGDGFCRFQTVPINKYQNIQNRTKITYK